jgi:aryl-alcohol dehydrogenase-like predicted oxidoreductase
VSVTTSIKHTTISGSRVGRVGIGCETLGGYEWGDLDIKKLEAGITSALEISAPEGKILFDTADTYGPFTSEQRLGRLITGRRDSAFVSTKFGVRLDHSKRAWYDNSPDYMEIALDGSLKRLKTDYIDLYQLHWPDDKTPLEEVLYALEKFVEKGKIKGYGVCNVHPSEIVKLAPHFTNLNTFSLEFSILNQSSSDEIRALTEAGMVFIAYGCLAQGLLSGKYGTETKFGDNDRRRRTNYKNFHGKKFDNNLKIIGELKKYFGEQLPLSQVALSYVLSTLPNSIALSGIKDKAQLDANLLSLSSKLTKTDLAFIKKICSNVL